MQLYLQKLNGKLTSERPREAINFDDPSSFTIYSDEALIVMTMDQLAAVMNGFILSSPGAQIQDVKLRADGDRPHISGWLNKGIPLPFQAEARVAATPEGKIGIAIDKFSGARVALKGFLEALGLDLQALVSAAGANGMTIRGNSLIIDPETALPPPQIRGRISRANIASQTLILTIGKPSAEAPPRAARGYLLVRGGTVKFGRLEMFGTDLKMMGQDPRGPFNFYLREYDKQLIAGYSKTTQSLGVQVLMPNYSNLARPSAKSSTH